MLPKLNGFAVTAAVREAGVRVPVLMLTAKQGEFDQTEALDTGADDFLSKPFSYPVLLARLRALIRRGGSAQGAVLCPRRHPSRHPGAPVLAGRRGGGLDGPGVRPARLPPAPRRANRSRRRSLLQHVWDPSDERDANVVEVYIGYLRRKLDRPGRAVAHRHRPERRVPAVRAGAGPGPAAADG